MGCRCEWIDIGVGEQRVTDNPDCPEHNPQQEEGGSMDIESEIYQVLGRITDVDPHERLEAASELVELIRAVARDELSKSADDAHREAAVKAVASCSCERGHYSNCPQREINAWVRDRVSTAPFCACGWPRGHLWACSESDAFRQREVCVVQVGLFQQIHETQWVGGTDGVPEHCAVCERLKPCGNCGRTPPQDGRCPWCCPGCGSTEGIHTDGSCVN